MGVCLPQQTPGASSRMRAILPFYRLIHADFSPWGSTCSLSRFSLSVCAWGGRVSSLGYLGDKPSLLPRLRLRFLFVDSRLQLNACGRTCFFFFLIETVQFFRVSSRFAFEFSSLKERRVEVRPRSHGCIRRCTQTDLGIWFT